MRLQERGTVVFSAAIDGAVYARHGTTIETRLTVIDKRAADGPDGVPGFARHRAGCRHAAALGHGARAAATARRDRAAPMAPTLAACACRRDRARHRIAWVPRQAVGASRRPPTARPSSSPTRPSTGSRPRAGASARRSTRTTPCSRSASPARRRIRRGSCSRRRWPRSRRPSRPTGRTFRTASSSEGLLSDAQLESVIYAGEAHASHLAGAWTVDATFDVVAAAPDDADGRRALPARLVPGRRHRLRQGPAGRPASSSTTGSRAGAGRCGSPSPKADRGRAARLVGTRPGASADPAAGALPPGHADPARRGHPVRHLRHAALGRARGQGFAPRPDPRLARASPARDAPTSTA